MSASHVEGAGFPGEKWWRLLRAADKRRDAKPKSLDSGAKAGTAENSEAQAAAGKHQDAMRETVESVVIAFVLAFLFRTFLAEAFVIPTGSMAPTLMGRHKDFNCQQCGYHYTVGASEEVDKESNYLIARLTASICPNCRHTNDIYHSNVFNGDRILVNKFPYEFTEPDRFDVFVFRYPEDPQVNYIKRLVGLPGESLRIERGDLFARRGTEGEFRILRKPDLSKQRLLQQIVYDDSHPPTLLLNQGWPEHWAALRRNPEASSLEEWLPAENSWHQDSGARSFQIQAGPEWESLRYRHFSPTDLDWERVAEGKKPTTRPLPELITDFCGYNAHRGRHVPEYQQWTPEGFWVGDLILSASVDVKKAAGASPAFELDLVEGVRRYVCRFNLQTGIAELLRTDDLKGDGSLVSMASAATPVKGTGRHAVSFANVDDRLCLWVDNRLIKFDGETEYTPPPVRDPQRSDLHPAGIAARDCDVTVSKLLLERDIYYRAVKSPRDDEAEGSIAHRLAGSLSDPKSYAKLYNQDVRSVEFDPLDDDEFFAMGDNSARSYDGRLWRDTQHSHHAHAVNRRALIGKAFFVYWPHGVPFLNGGKGYPVAMHSIHKDSPVENYPLYTAPFYPQWWRWSRIR